MVYVIVRDIENQADRTVCLVQAASKDDALKMVGGDKDTTAWASFTNDKVIAVADTKEGYLTQDM